MALARVEVVTLQPAAIVDHLCLVRRETVLEAVGGPDNVGGSRRCSADELKALLSNIPECNTRAGGSAANVARALSAGFGVSTGLVGARGADEWGEMFVRSLTRSKVHSDRVRVLPGATGRSVILTDSSTGERTMRTFMSSDGILAADGLTAMDYEGVSWAFLSAYSMYHAGMLRAAATLAVSLGVRVMLDLASWEVVQEHKSAIQELLEEGLISCCICNEDEAKELMGRPAGWTPQDTIRSLLEHCAHAIVTLGSKGCMAASKATGEVVSEPAVPVASVLDTTGAGDAFSSGFLYGLLRGLPLQRCASIGCLTGAAAVRTLGADLGPADWHWFHSRIHSALAAEVVDNTPEEVYHEMLDAYALVGRIGVGAVYFGSARLGPTTPYWAEAVALARDVALLLKAPTWTGGGPGMMQAASEGAQAAGMPVGAVKISREAGKQQHSVRVADYLPQGDTVICKYMPARKAALTDAGVRQLEQHRTAYVFLPGGLGTMDELFAILTLIQLKKLNTQFPVPLIIVNYNGFYDGLVGLLQAFDSTSVLQKVELDGLVWCKDNSDVLTYLSEFYSITKQ